MADELALRDCIHLSLCLYLYLYHSLSFFTLPLFISESFPLFYLCVSLRVFLLLSFTQGSLSHQVSQSLFLSLSFSLTLRLSLCFSHSHNLSPDQSLFLFLPISNTDFLRVSTWLSLCAYVSLILGISLTVYLLECLSFTFSHSHSLSISLHACRPLTYKHKHPQSFSIFLSQNLFLSVKVSLTPSFLTHTFIVS